MTGHLPDIARTATQLQQRQVSPVHLVRTCLERIEARRELNAFITVLADSAMQEARNAEREIADGHYRGPMHGIPVSVKDLIDVAGTPTTSGSAVPPRCAEADAPVVAWLRSAGAIVIGKTNLHEFAFGTTSEESAFGPVRHPKDLSHSPGGSSGGAAVALVEGMCFGSVGTDTGGSIRIPSAACGTVGLKPTRGELTIAGIVPLSTTFDHVGPMARTVADAATMFYAMKGAGASPTDPLDRAIRLAIPRPYFCDRLHPAVRAALDRSCAAIAAAGHTVTDVEVAHASWTPSVYLHVVLPEASWFHAETLASHPAGYSPGVRLRLEMGRYLLAEDYVRARRLADLLGNSVDDAQEGFDALLLPTLAIPAPPIGATSVEVESGYEPVRTIMLRLTQLFNVTGHPAIAMPAGTTSDGWPVGLQLVGKRGQTGELLRVAAAAEPYITPGSVGGVDGTTSGR